jgi:hypothetical protein
VLILYSMHTLFLSRLAWPFLSLQDTLVGCPPLQHTYWSGGRTRGTCGASCRTAATPAVHMCWGWWCLLSGIH